MKYTFASFVSISLASKVVELDHSNFDQVKYSRKGWFIEFYQPECKPSQDWAPQWDEFADRWSNRLNIAKYDCYGQSNWYICEQHLIEETPTFVYYPPNGFEGYKYKGKRDFTDMLLFSLHGRYKPKENNDEL